MRHLILLLGAFGSLTLGLAPWPHAAAQEYPTRPIRIVVPYAAGAVAAKAADALVRSAGLVDAAPWLVWRVQPPHLALVILYYVALSIALVARSRFQQRTAAAIVAGMASAPLMAP